MRECKGVPLVKGVLMRIGCPPDLTARSVLSLLRAHLYTKSEEKECCSPAKSDAPGLSLHY
jgi:hypothetical protein